MNQHKIVSKERKAINDALYHLCKVRHTSIPLMEIAAILEPFGISTEDGIYTGREGRSSETLLRAGMELEHVLVLNWYKGEYDKCWEINAYVS